MTASVVPRLLGTLLHRATAHLHGKRAEQARHYKAVMLALLVTCAGAVAAKPALAPELAVVQQRVAQVAVLRGDFEQDKQVQGFKNPLRSSGKFLLVRDRGVVWSTLKPFPSELVLTRDRILSRQRDGSTRVELDGRQQPAMRAVNATMFALMSGDVRALSAQFKVQAQALPNESWKLLLLPKSGALKQAFTQIELQGDRYVRTVRIDERNGDRTQLRFKNLAETPATLSADEAKRLD